MSDAARRFQCHMPGGPEVVDIVNVLVHEGSLCIVIKSAKREEPYVLQVLPSGIRFAHTDISSVVVDIHRAELAALAREAAAAEKLKEPAGA